MVLKIIANLDGGDLVTSDNELTYKIYGSSDNFSTPIATLGSATNDEKVIITNGVVTIDNVDVGTENNFKITAIDSAGNESELSESAFDPQAQIQVDRIIAAGGTIEDQNVIDSDIKFLKSIGLFANLKYAVDPRAGITQRIDGSDIFASKIFDYSGSDADADNNQGSEQPKKGILNGITALDFDGVDDRLTDEDTVSFLAGAEMFSVAVYAQDFNGSEFFARMVDKFSPDKDGKAFGRKNDNIILFSQETSFTPFQNVQILVTGTSNEDNLATGFIDGSELSQSTTSVNHIGKVLGSVRAANTGNRFAKGQFQKNWDFNALPTESQRNAINTYLINQFNIPV
jgi:hypothetical protein